MIQITNSKSAIRFIFITMLIDIIGIGIIIPVIPKLLQELNHSNVSEAAKLGGWLAFAYAATQFVFAPIMGNLSDKFGRRPVLLLSMLAFAFDYLMLALSTNIYYLFLARIVAGITGASISTAMAYMADVSTPEEKAKNFGLIGAAFGIGFVIGPVIGGLLGQYGSRVPFYAASILCLLNFIYGYFVLPESLSKDKRRDFEWKTANPVGALLRLKKYPKITYLIAAMFFMYFANHSVNGNWGFYTIYRYQWDEKMIGISLGVVGILTALVQGVLTRYLNPIIGNSKSILWGFSFYLIGYSLFAVAEEAWMIFVFLLPFCLGGISGPALQSEITNHIPANEQGQIQGTLASLNSATAILGPVIMTNIFYYFTKDTAPFIFPGAPFVLAAIFVIFALIFAKKGLDLLTKNKSKNE